MLLLGLLVRAPGREELLAVFPCDAFRDLARQGGEPGARPRRVLGDVMPALGRIAVGADHEAIRELEERLAPCRVDASARAVIGAEGEVAPQICMLAQHFGDA